MIKLQLLAFSQFLQSANIIMHFITHFWFPWPFSGHHPLSMSTFLGVSLIFFNNDKT